MSGMKMSEPPVAVDVADRRPHRGDALAVLAVGQAGEQGLVLEGALAGVLDSSSSPSRRWPRRCREARRCSRSAADGAHRPAVRVVTARPAFVTSVKVPSPLLRYSASGWPL